MTSEELKQRWLEVNNTYEEKKERLEAFIQKWKDGKLALDDERAQKLVDEAAIELDRLKKELDILTNEKIRVIDEETLEAERLANAKLSVKARFGVSPDSITITGGTLAANASESHITGRGKTLEELEAEKQYLLEEIKRRVMNKEITLAEASKLKTDVDIAYGYVEPIEEAPTRGSR